MNDQYGFNYKPTIVKPQLTKLYAPAKLTSWAIGGDKMIDTKFEYDVITNANLKRQLPEDAWLSAYSIPAVVNYGTTGIRPAGISLDLVKNDNVNTITYTENLTRALWAAQTAHNKLWAAQYTDLPIISMVNNADNTFPVILTYQLALIYNSYFLTQPILHYQSFRAVLDSLKDYNVEAAYRVDAIYKQLARSKVTSSLKTYLDVLAKSSFHIPTVNSAIEFMKVEKLNRSLNTSYDYTCTKLQAVDSDDNYTSLASICTVNRRPNAGSTTRTDEEQSLLPSGLIASPGFKALQTRGYIDFLLKAMALTETQFNNAIRENGELWTWINHFIEAWNIASKTLVALPTIFAPYYTAVSVIPEFIDMSIFGTYDFSKPLVTLRNSSYYSRANLIASIDFDAAYQDKRNLYPTFNAYVPLFMGALKPDDTFDSNGIFLLNTPTDLTPVYKEFIDLEDCKFNYAIIQTQIKDFTSYFSNNTVTLMGEAGDYSIPTYKLQFENDALFLSRKAQPNTLTEALSSPVSELINFFAVKTYYLQVAVDAFGANGNFVVKSPELTGLRPVALPTNVDHVLDITPKLIGLIPTIPMAK